MSRVRDQQGRFISSSKNSQKDNSAGQSQEGKELNQPNYLSPTTIFLSKKKPEASPQESETVQGSLHTEVPLSEEQINEQYHSKEFLFLEAPLETKDNPQK
jgi:argininosuccinate synthase